METTKPPPLKRTESISNSSLSSFDNGDGPSRHYTPNEPQISRRLVDYFVVFSTQPRLKYKKKKKPVQEEQEEDDILSVDLDPQTPPRNFCCKKKPILKSRRESTTSTSSLKSSRSSKSNKSSSSSSKRSSFRRKKKKKDSKKPKSDTKSEKRFRVPPLNKRLKNRAVHLTDNMEDIDLIDLNSDAEPDPDNHHNAHTVRHVNLNVDTNDNITDATSDTAVSPNEKTPIVSHHKTKQPNNVHFSYNTKDNHEKPPMSPPMSPPLPPRKRERVPSMLRESSLVLPVTTGSFVDSDNEIEKKVHEVDEEQAEKHEELVSKASELTLETVTHSETKKEEEEEEEEILTPSRLRASQESSFDQISDVEDSNVTKRNDTKTELKDGSNGGTAGNIHLPNQQQNDDKSNNVYLVPNLSARYPQQDHGETPLNPILSQFCFPHGQIIYFTTEYVMPRIHYFVLTNDRGKKMYGTCLTVYEEFEIEEHEEIDEEDLQHFCRKDDVNIESTDSESSIEVSLDQLDKIPPLYHPKVICILSSWPYLHAFREYLSQVYRLATMTNMMTCPIERFVLNICDEVPAPPPGMFEIRLEILNSTIRFWAPPANQPIPYVSIPFNTLFECLDINNIMFVWYALTLEYKVLLVSSQNSLLTLCAEILCSLLFPMEWRHLYIPVLPIFLSPMLDAPFPYLCGITRANFNHAIGDVSEETIVVDLDQNLITRGDKTLPFPPMPLKRRTKLEACLKKNVGDVFWMARGVTKTEVENYEEQGISSPLKRSYSPIVTDMTKTVRIWKEKLNSYDEAFNLAFTPDSENMMNEDSKSYVSDEFAQSKWDIVQEAFLTFFASMLGDYKRFINTNLKTPTFRTKGFLAAQRADFKPFLKEFVQTQQFDCYITKAMFTPNEPDVIFFDQSIAAKRNRSKMALRKKRTPFLQSAKAQKQLRVIDAAKPSAETESNFNILDHIYGTTPEKKNFTYSKWPETFDPNLMKNPRQIPDVIAAEFDKRDSDKEKQDELIELNDFRVTEVDYSIEITTFTLFFILCCELVGDELESIRNQYLLQGEHLMVKDAASKSRFPNCADVCSLGSGTSNATVDREYTASYQNYAMNSMKDNQLAGLADDLLDTKLESAKMFAFAELDLAFSALETLFLRKLKPNVDALKALMAACGRCDCSHRASKLMTMIQEKGVYVDSETYYYFCMNAPLDDQKRRKDWSGLRMKTLKRKKGHKKKTNDEYLDGETSSYSGTGSSFQDSMSVTSSTVDRSRLPPRHATPSSKKRKRLTNKDRLGTTEQVEKHINIGDTLLQYLYKDLEINTSDVTCQSCGESLNEDQVRLGWNFCSFIDNTTTCPFCKNTFVPSFVVKTSEPNFIGSQGRGTPLHCEFLSPWVLHKEIHLVTRDSSLKNILDPKWRYNGDKNSTVWWNLVITFQRQKLPITFLLQGSFRERLIMPMPMFD